MTKLTSPTKPPPGKNGYTYRQQYGIVVTCRDEAHQQSLYTRLLKMGLALKVVVV